MNDSSSHVVIRYLVQGPAAVDARPTVTRPPTAAAPVQSFADRVCKVFLWSFVISFAVCFSTGIAALCASDNQRYRNEFYGPEISLNSFSVSNLSIVDDRISGNWSIELYLKNLGSVEVIYADIKYTVVYSHAPDIPIMDLPLGHHLNQRSRWEGGGPVAVDFHGLSENSRLRHPVADSMTRDVIENGVLEFDLIVVAPIMLKIEFIKESSVDQIIVLSCNGLRVLISPEKSAPLINAVGRAAEIPVCDLLRLRET